jgi:vacuolar-type H+-ATPase subunit C/Vma6
MSGTYLFANGRIGALERDFMPPRAWQLMMSAPDYGEVMRLLADTWYGRFASAASDLQEAFEAALAATEAELIELAEDEALVTGLLRRRDCRNARFLWKAALCGSGTPPVTERPGVIPVHVLEAALSDEEARSTLPAPLAAAAGELSGTAPSPMELDSVMDRTAMEIELLDLPVLDPALARIAAGRVDSHNLLSAARLAPRMGSGPAGPDLLLDGGSVPAAEIAAALREGRLPELAQDIPDLERAAAPLREALSSGAFPELERELDRAMLGLLEEGSMALSGPVPLACFVMRREMEISHLRILLAARAAGLDRTRLLRRLPRG